MNSKLVFQDWWLNLSMQQQSVLILAIRGPDTMRKYHPCKTIIRMYRATVLKAAYLGRAMELDEGDETMFMHLHNISDTRVWNLYVKSYFDTVDELPMHYHLHLLHGAEIIGYKHPHPFLKARWQSFYLKGCEGMHINPETEAQMDERLNDWNQEFWSKEE
jgi:hypothetical protein